MKERMAEWVENHIHEYPEQYVTVWFAGSPTEPGPLRQEHFDTEDECREWLGAYIFDHADLITPDPS